MARRFRGPAGGTLLTGCCAKTGRCGARPSSVVATAALRASSKLRRFNIVATIASRNQAWFGGRSVATIDIIAGKTHAAIRAVDAVTGGKFGRATIVLRTGPGYSTPVSDECDTISPGESNPACRGFRY